MNGCNECKRISRRTFLRQASAGMGALALSDPLLHTVASTFGQTRDGTGNMLVLCELNGGLDALSFLAPYTNSAYRSLRPVLALGEDAVTPLPDNSEYGISNLFPFFSELYADGNLAIVQQSGYPDSNGSHFESQEIFKYGIRNLGGSSGTDAPWYERLRRTYFDQPFGVLDTHVIGDPERYGYPDSTYRGAAQEAFGRLAKLHKNSDDASAKAVAESYERIDQRAAELREKTASFESTGEARGEFFRAAKLASADLGTQIVKLSYGGFDTHGSQDTANAELFPRLNSHFQQFVSDMKNIGMWERTCVCFYTEFGRRNGENGSPGTDHGHGGHMILAGPGVRGGLFGQRVTTADLNEDSLPYYVDFRAVFSSCINDWLGFDSKAIFEINGESFDKNVGGSLFA